MSPSRRGFLLGASALALAPAGVAAADPAHSVDPAHIGIQLYTVRDIMATDPQGTLNALGRIGYATVGVSGLYGHSPEEFRSFLDNAGLRAVLTHTSWEAMLA